MDRLGSPTATTGHPDPLGIHIGQAGQEIQAPDRVPGLQPHDALETQFRLGADEAPAPGAVHVRPLLLQSMGHPHANLLGIGVTLHVEDEGHTTHPRQGGATRQLGKPARLAELLTATLDQGVHRTDAVILQSPAMPVRTQDGRVFSTGGLPGRPEQQAGDKVTRNTLKIHLSTVKPGRVTLPKMTGFIGVRCGIGHKPVETRIRCLSSRLRTSHSLRVAGTSKGK